MMYPFLSSIPLADNARSSNKAQQGQGTSDSREQHILLIDCRIG